MKFSDLRPGDGAWVDHFGRHPAIVLAVSQSDVTVVTGTSRKRDYLVEIEILPASACGKSLGLTDPTYFNASKVAVINDASKLHRKAGRCPPDVFNSITTLVGVGAKAQNVATAAGGPTAAAPSVPATTESDTAVEGPMSPAAREVAAKPVEE